MGRPKQGLPFRDRTIGEVVCAALAPRVEEVVLLGGGGCPPPLAHLPRLSDVPGTRGPLAGMLAALRWSPRATWLIAACDLPLIDPAAIAWLLEQRRPGRWAVLPRVSATGVEPLLALYEPQARPLLEALHRRGRPKPSLIADHPAVVSPEPPPELARAWTNVNTPEDLARVAGGEAEESDDGR
jgi:molybdopterin-guanine dinucleotide biosynthesis protein A